MKKYILLLFIISLTSCLPTNYKTTKKPEPNKFGFSVIEFDSCEYIMASLGYRGFLAHKGNCKFCKERRLKEMIDYYD